MRSLYLFAASLLFVGCSDESTIRFTLRSDDEVLSGIRVEAVEGSRSRVLTAGDFTVRSSSARISTPVMAVGDKGELKLMVTLDVDGQTIAQGVSSVHLRSNFKWFVTFERQVGDPFDTCFGGCFGSAGFSVDNAFQREPDEKLWVNWVGVERGLDVSF